VDSGDVAVQLNCYYSVTFSVIIIIIIIIITVITVMSLICYREPGKEVATAPAPRSAHPQTGMRPQTALRPPSARPPSARPAAPRIRDRGEIRIAEESR